MNKENYLEFAASFMIALMLTIPLYVADANAAVNRIGVKGADNIEGYARANDFLNINANVDISGDVITPEQVVLGSALPFTSCSASSQSGYDCAIRFPASGTQLFDAASVTFTVNSFYDDGTPDDSKTGTVTIDALPPQIRLAATQSTFTSQQDVAVNYNATDIACGSASCSGKCAGLKTLEFFTLDNTLLQNAPITATGCSQIGQFTASSSSFTNGPNTLFARATDKFNQVSADFAVTFNVQKDGPSFVSNSFSISRKGINLNTFSPNIVQVDVGINVTSPNLNLSSVRADLSSLNPNDNLGNVQATCNSVNGNVYRCTLAIDINPGTAGVKTIVVNASDTFGNRESITLNKILSYDDQGPIASSLFMPTEKDGKLYGKSSGNTVTAIFDDITGISPDEALLHASGNVIPASSCLIDSLITCTWNNVNLVNGIATISVGGDTTDVLGNGAMNFLSREVQVDDISPQIVSLNMTPIGGTTQAFDGYFKVGDKIGVIAEVKESGALTAIADFSKFVNGANKLVGSCDMVEAGKYTCVWLTNQIDIEATNSVVFNFTDNAGNSLIVTKSLKSYGLNAQANPNYWTNTIACSPQNVDREIGPLINQRVYCHVRLKMGSQPVSTVFIGQASCTGDTSIVQSVETFNTASGSTAPVLKLTLKKTDYKVDSVKLNCNIPIYSKVGSSITSNAEIETANVEIGFYNLPLGEMSKEVKDKIEEAKNDAEGIWELISALNKFIFYAKKICQLIGIFYGVIVMLYNVYTFLTGAVEVPLDKIPFAQTIGLTIKPVNIAGCNAQTSMRKAGESSYKLVSKFCRFVNCQYTPVIGTYQQWIGKQINSLPGASYLPQDFEEITKDEGVKSGQFVEEKSTGGYKSVTSGGTHTKDELQSGLTRYMNIQDSLVLSTVFVCLPGIVYNLDKYRQIKCLYADCLENGVGNDGLPLTACEDQKAYATCKYVTGEIFAVIPYTALADHFISIVKNIFSNPFLIVGVGIGAYCWATCPNPESATRLSSWTLCEGFKLLSQLGEVIGQIKNIIDEGFTIREDYCSRLDTEDDDKEDSKSPLTK